MIPEMCMELVVGCRCMRQRAGESCRHNHKQKKPVFKIKKTTENLQSHKTYQPRERPLPKFPREIRSE